MDVPRTTEGRNLNAIYTPPKFISVNIVLLSKR